MTNNIPSSGTYVTNNYYNTPLPASGSGYGGSPAMGAETPLTNSSSDSYSPSSFLDAGVSGQPVDASILAPNQKAAMWGAGNIGGADKGHYTFKESGTFNLLQDNDVALNARVDGPAGSDKKYIKDVGVTVAGQQVEIRSDGSVVINGEDQDLSDGKPVILGNGSTITEKGNQVAVTSPEYKMTFNTNLHDAKNKNAEYISVKVDSGANGVNTDGVAPTGLLGETFDGATKPQTGSALDSSGYQRPNIFAMPNPTFDPGCNLPDPESSMPDPSYILPDPGCNLPDPESSMPDSGCILPDPGASTETKTDSSTDSSTNTGSGTPAASGGLEATIIPLLSTVVGIFSTLLQATGDSTSVSTNTAPAAGTNTAPAAGTNTAPAAGTNTAPAAGTNTAPAAGTNTAPAAGTNTAPAAGTNTAPAAGTNTAPATDPSSIASALGPILMNFMQVLAELMQTLGISMPQANSGANPGTTTTQ